MNHLAFLVELQDMSTLLTVLTQVSCLGSKLTHVVAGENRARIAVLVPHRVAGHFANRLRNIIGVIELRELSKPDQVDALRDNRFRLCAGQWRCVVVENDA